MSRAARIRQYLAKHGPATAREVCDALQPIDTDDIEAYCASIAWMVRRGVLVTIKKQRPGQRQKYKLGRPLVASQSSGKPVTGRAQRIRDYLAQHDRGFTPAELRAVIDPKARADAFCASLSQVAAQGQIARANSGRVSCYAKSQALADQALADALEARATRQARPTAPTPRAARRSRAKVATVRTKPVPSSKLKAPPAREVPRGMPPPPTDEVRAAITSIARSRPAARPAPVTCALDGVPDRQRLASERIAADIAEFQARGGKIERLGPTKFFDRIGMEAANHAPPRRPRTGTLDLDD